MGYVSKDIAEITEPKQVTLSSSPNFVQFGSKPSVKTYLELDIKVNALPASYGWTTPNGFYNLAVPNLSGFIASNSWRRSVISVNEGDTFLVTSNIPTTGTGSLALIHFYDASGNLLSYIGRGGTTTIDYYYDFEVVVPNLATTMVVHCKAAFQSSAKIIKKFSGLTELNITAPDGTVHAFNGTVDPNEVGGNVFFVSLEKSDTAENLKIALLSDAWVKANYEVIIPFVWQGGNVVNGDVIKIKSKGAGEDYEFTIDAPNNIGNSAYLLTWVNETSNNGDSISGEASTAEIDLDLYIDPDVFLGQDDRPISSAKIGNYLTTLSKTYSGTPVWFELNALFNQYPSFNKPSGAFGWFNTGTVSVYRFVAKVKALNSFSFYQSNALFVVKGYGKVSEVLDLEDYVYSSGAVKLLTNKPKTPYVLGQKEYLNFIFRDNQRGATNPINFNIDVVYKAYSTAGDYLGTLKDHTGGRASFSIVNTCALNIDQLLEIYPNAGIVKVSLGRGAAIISNEVEYEIRPENLHTLNAFTFLNKLGGWDVINFDAETQDEIKPSNETYNKTVTPSFKKGDSVETVYQTKLANPLTIDGAPVNNLIAEWLKEFAKSPAIYDNEGNYIVLEDFTLKQTSATSNYHTPKIKFRLSEND